MDNYKHKYNKYKKKYTMLKRAEDTKLKEVDLYLFFDLLQVSHDIITSTNKDDIMIIIGDTPSYMIPFLKPFRKVIILPFSNKPYGCFNPPNAIADETMNYDVYMPTLENQDNYFNYLNTKTDLTREFVKSNWNKLTLIDSSSGQSIHGVSIFLNRYIGNINANNMECYSIDGSEPLQFIRLTGGNSKMTNLDPNKTIQFYENKFDFRNFNPKLIILIGSSIFYHREAFMITEEYPRYVPSYYVQDWDKDPIYLKEGEKVIKQLSKLVNLFYKYDKNNKTDLIELVNIIKNMPIIKHYKKHIDNITKNNVSVKVLSSLFNMIYNDVTIMKRLSFDDSKNIDKVNEY